MIKRSSFMVFPSVLEGFGIVIIEAFACKKPVLVSDVRPLSDIVINDINGYALPLPFDVNSWSERIIQLLKDREKCELMGRNAYSEFVDKYELDKIVSKMETLYSRQIARTFD